MDLHVGWIEGVFVELQLENHHQQFLSPLSSHSCASESLSARWDCCYEVMVPKGTRFSNLLVNVGLCHLFVAEHLFFSRHVWTNMFHLLGVE